MPDDYGLSAAQAQYDRQEGTNPFVKDDEIEPANKSQRMDKGTD
ncbi:MAG TPA: hypothetical protein VM577_02135 [Anaerovoracaceae bacterium]|nr:hypothetical protein [Anaerovoracaceae bacterium]